MSKKKTECGICDAYPFERNRYFYGKLMTVRDLCQEQDYLNAKRWLINRTVLGWGVVCGLDVRLAEDRLCVSPGIALDCCGHEILVCEPESIPLQTVHQRCECREEEPPNELFLCLEYLECPVEPVPRPPVGCDEKESVEHNRIRESYRLVLREPDEICKCEPPECYLDALREAASDDRCATPGLHDFLCSQLKEGCPSCDCPCVVLARVWREEPPEESPPPPVEKKSPGKKKGSKTGKDKKSAREEERRRHDEYRTAQEGCEEPPPPEVHVDPCGDRKLVVSNARLFQLIQCFHPDAPRIVALSWAADTLPDRVIGWDLFVDRIKRGLSVVFDQPMEPRTLNRCTFVVAALIAEPATGHLVRKVLPSQEIAYSEKDGCGVARWIPDADWVGDELDSKKSELAAGIDIEILIRGNNVAGRNGRAGDLEFVADTLPTGNGIQGGQFFDCFHVESRPTGRRKQSKETADVEPYEDF